MSRFRIYADDGVWYVMVDNKVKKMFATKSEAERYLESLAGIAIPMERQDDDFWPNEFDGGAD